MIMNYLKFRTVFLFLSMLLIFGCSGNVKVGGKVTFLDDGSPLTAGTVYFGTETFEARGDLRSDGTYDLGSLYEKDGLPKGKYQVSVRNAFLGSGEEAIPLIDEKYASGTTSGITFDVTSKTRKFDFTVERPKK
jgi:hypothetical protein